MSCMEKLHEMSKDAGGEKVLPMQQDQTLRDITIPADKLR